MKKLISIFLILILSLSVTYGAEYEIEWFDDSDGQSVIYSDDDFLILFDDDSTEAVNIHGDTLFKVASDSFISIDGDYLKSTEYYEIHSGEKGFESLKALAYLRNSIYKDNDSIQWQLTKFYDSKGNMIYEINQLNGALNNRIDIIPEAELQLVYNDNLLLKLCDKDGNDLSDYEYSSYKTCEPYSSYVILSGQNKELICNLSSGDYLEVDSVYKIVDSGNKAPCFIEQKHNGKLLYYNYKPELVSEYEFDELINVYYGNVIFKSNDNFYVFNRKGKLEFSGNEKSFQNIYGYILKNSDSNLIYSDAFSNVIPICDNVYLTRNKDFIYSLYNQGHKVTDNITDIIWQNQKEIPSGPYIQTFDDVEMVTSIFDIEGNKIIEDNNILITNGIDIFITTTPEKKTGRIILKDTNPNVRINGKLLVSDTMPRIKNGRTLVPLRALAEETGFEVSYNEETKEINITNKDKIISFKIGEEKAYKNGEEIILEAPPEIVNNRTLVPLRAVSDAFGYDISWNAGRRLAEIVIKQE